MNRAFACNANAGSQSLVGSFVPSHDVLQVSGNEVAVDFGFAGNSMPSWWQFKAVGSCRQNSLAYVTSAPVTAVHCEDWSAGQAVGGLLAYNLGIFGANSARLLGQSVVLPSALVDLTAGQEYFSFQLTINNLNTVGAGACGGCDLGGCIALKSIKLVTSDPTHDVILTPQRSGPGAYDGLATRQGGAGVITFANGGQTLCLAATPVRNGTWSGVKALYR